MVNPGKITYNITKTFKSNGLTEKSPVEANFTLKEVYISIGGWIISLLGLPIQRPCLGSIDPRPPSPRSDVIDNYQEQDRFLNVEGLPRPLILGMVAKAPDFGDGCQGS